MYYIRIITITEPTHPALFKSLFLNLIYNIFKLMYLYLLTVHHNKHSMFDKKKKNNKKKKN
jgi:hypothetical protein